MSFRPEGHKVAQSGEIYSKQISRLRFAALEMTRKSASTIYNRYYRTVRIAIYSN